MRDGKHWQPSWVLRGLRSMMCGGLLAITVGPGSTATLQGQEPPGETPATQAESTSKVGIQDLLGEYAPEGVDFAAFESLDGNWSEWSSNVAEMVAKLYEEELSPSEQSELIGQLKKKSAVMKSALNDSTYASIHDRLDPVFGAFSRRIDVIDAVVDSLEFDPDAVREKQLAAAGDAIVDALAELADDLQTIRGGSV